MSEKRRSFLLYKSWLNPVMKLKDNDAGELFLCILKYVNDEPVEVKTEFKQLYNDIIYQIEYEWSKYNPKNEKYHWNYKGGISTQNHAIRNSQFYKYWRLDVFERDKYTCRSCGQIGGELNAHHIKHFAKHPEIRFKISNGLTLCKKCHISIHQEEKLLLKTSKI